MKLGLLNGYVFDGNLGSKLEKKNILIEDDKIIQIGDFEIPSDCKVIDLNGKYVIPGLINLHAHLFGTGKPSKALGGGSKQKFLIKFCSTKIGQIVLRKLVKSHVKQALYSGVTTLRSSGDFFYSDVKVRDLVNKGKCVGPRMITPGWAITVSGGHGDGTFAKSGNTKEELERLVMDNINNKVDYIKICVTGGVMDAKKKGEPGELKMNAEQTKIVCDLAHKYNLLVASHTESSQGIKVASQNGVDTIEHGSFMDEEDVKVFKKNNVVDVCTLSPALPLAKFDSSITKLNEMCIYNSEFIMNGMIDGAKKCIDNNILVGLGTDASCPFVSQYNMYRELCWFKKYIGVSNEFALYSATLANAKILRMDKEIGSIEINKKADLLIMDNNPLENLNALGNLDFVIHNGKIYNSKKLKKNKYIDDKLNKLM